MSIADYVILAVVALAAVGAVIYGRRHPGGCGGNCTFCKHGCEKKDQNPEQKEYPMSETE